MSGSTKAPPGSQASQASDTSSAGEGRPIILLPDLCALNVPSTSLVSLGSEHLQYHAGWKIIICVTCKDGLAPTTRAIKDHLATIHSHAEWAGDLSQLELAAAPSSLVFRGPDNALPAPINHLPLRDIFACGDCSFAKLKTQKDQVLAHLKKVGHNLLPAGYKGQTIEGNGQITQKQRIKGSRGKLFAVQDNTQTAMPFLPPSPYSTLSLHFSKLSQGLSDPFKVELGSKDQRASLKRLGWYDTVKDYNRSLIAQLTQLPRSHPADTQYDIDLRLHHLEPLLRAHFDAAFNELSSTNSYIKTRLHGHTGKQLNAVQRPTDYFRELYRFVSFAIRIYIDEDRLSADVSFTKAATDAIDVLDSYFVQAAERDSTEVTVQAAEEAVGVLVFELFFGKSLEGVSDPRHWAIGYFLPFNTYNKGAFDKPSSMVPKLKHLDWCARLICVHHFNKEIEAESHQDADAATENIASSLAEGQALLFDRPNAYSHLVYCVQVIETEAKGQLLLPDSDWCGPDGKTFLYKNLPIQLSHITWAVQLAIDHCWDILTNHLMFGLVWRRPEGSILIDDHGNTNVGYAFSVDPENQFGDIAKVLFDHINGVDSLRAQFGFRVTQDGIAGNHNQIETYIRRAEDFRKHLAVALHIGCGAPSRGTELLSSKLFNLPTSTRDFFAASGTIIQASSYGKTSSNTGRHTVRPRAMPPILAEIFTTYVVVVRPFEAALWAMYRPSPAPNRLAMYLFSENNAELSTAWLSKELQRAFKTAGAPGFGVAEYRHIYIAMGRRFFGLDEGAEDDDDEYGSSIFDLQAGHTSRTAATNYARDKSTPGAMTAEHLLDYVQASNRWAESLGILDYTPRPPTPMAPYHTQSELEVEINKRKNPAGPIVLTPAKGSPSSDFHSPFSASVVRPSKRKPVDDTSIASASKRLSVESLRGQLPGDDGAFSTPSILTAAGSVTPATTLVNSARTPGTSSSNDSPTKNYTPQTPSGLSRSTLPVVGMSSPPRTVGNSLGSPLKLKTSAAARRTAKVQYDTARLDRGLALARNAAQPLAPPSDEELLFQLRLMTGDPDASFRAHQLQAANLILDCPDAALIILPTGGGKTITYTVITKLQEYTGLTLVLSPNVALTKDLMTRFTKWRLNCELWSGETNMKTGIMVVSSDITRVVVEEAHLCLQASHWRQALGRVGILRAELPQTPLVFVSGTVPPANAAQLLDKLYVDEAHYLRVPNIRPSHRLAVWPGHFWALIDEKNPRKDCRKHVYALVDHLLDQWCSPTGTIIIFCTNKITVDLLAGDKRWFKFYRTTGKSNKEQKTDAEMQAGIKQFIDGQGSRVAVCTPVLSVGVDIATVEVVLHVGFPNDATDFLQEIGRCGRTAHSASKALSIWIPLGTPIPSDRPFDAGETALQDLKDGKNNCRWVALLAYNDGITGSCTSLGISPCDICEFNQHGLVPAYYPPNTRWTLIQKGVRADDVRGGANTVTTGLLRAPKTAFEDAEDQHCAPPPAPLDVSPAATSLLAQSLSAVRSLKDIRESSIAFFDQTTRINRARNEAFRAAAQGRAAPVHDAFGKECMVCYLHSKLPHSLTGRTDHPEKPGHCGHLPADIFGQLTSFRKELKDKIGRTGRHCRSCLFPYMPCPSQIHGDPTPQGGCTVHQRFNKNKSSDTDGLITVLYYLFHLVPDDRGGDIAFQQSELTDMLAMEGDSGCLVAMELFMWIMGKEL